MSAAWVGVRGAWLILAVTLPRRRGASKLLSGTMDELLLEEESRSEAGEPGAGGDPRSSSHHRSPAGTSRRLKALLVGSVPQEIRSAVRSFCRRNGLLTLSVVAVVTGCTLGFLLRGSHLSSQVWLEGVTKVTEGHLWGEGDLLIRFV